MRITDESGQVLRSALESGEVGGDAPCSMALERRTDLYLKYCVLYLPKRIRSYLQILGADSYMGLAWMPHWFQGCRRRVC
jgi:hypothetical protein